MSNRETQALVTPSGKSFEIKAYITPNEKREIRRAFNECTERVYTENGDERLRIKDGADTVIATENAMIRVLITSYDGSSENILDRLLEADSADFSFIMNLCTDIVNPEGKKKEDPK